MRRHTSGSEQASPGQRSSAGGSCARRPRPPARRRRARNASAASRPRPRRAGGQLDLAPLGGRQVRALRVQPLVALAPGPGRCSRSHSKKISRTEPRRNSVVAADVGRVRLGRQLDDPLDLLGRVVDPRHQRRDQDPGRDAVAVELGDRLQPRLRVRRVRLGRPPRLLVQRRHRQARADLGHRRDLLHQVQIAQQQRRLGQDRARVAEVPQRLPDPAHQLVAPLDPLVRVGVRAQRDLARPSTTAAPAPPAAPRAR